MAFCPAFERTPTVEFEVISGPPVRLELGQVLPLGARWDVKLAQSAKQATAILLRFTATLKAATVAEKSPARCA